jgi:hypothetical protein
MMRAFVATLLLLACFAPMNYGQKTRFGQKTEAPNPAEYTLKVHVSASRLKVECANGICSNVLYADVILSGKKLTLYGNAVEVTKTLVLIAPGDYPMKLIKDVHNSDGSLLNQEYDMLLTDNIVWQSFTVGISE